MQTIAVGMAGCGLLWHLKQLCNFSCTGAYVLPSEFFVGEGGVFLEEVDCSGGESSLLDCHNHGILGFHQCGHDELLGRGELHSRDASISCEGNGDQ